MNGFISILQYASKKGYVNVESNSMIFVNFMPIYIDSRQYWKDKRDVLCLHFMEVQWKTTPRDIDVPDVQRPSLISDYNKNMGGVDHMDHMDHMLVYYAIGRKTIKWYKRIFWRVFEMAIVNSFVLYTLCHPEKKITHWQRH